MFLIIMYMIYFSTVYLTSGQLAVASCNQMCTCHERLYNLMEWTEHELVECQNQSGGLRPQPYRANHNLGLVVFDSIMLQAVNGN